MKLLPFWILNLLPLAFLIFFFNGSDSMLWIYIAIWLLIYIPIIDYLRLKYLGINEKWYIMFIPFYKRIKYFKQMFFLK